MKNVVETEGHTNDVTVWRICVACWISKVTWTYAHDNAHAPGYHMHAHTGTHACTHRPISNTYFSSTATMIHEPVSVLRYTYIACLVRFGM